MAYLGLSPEPDQYFSEISFPGDADNCARYCAWLASRKGGIVTMEYMERPPGCTCPDEIKGTEYTTELPMTPQQIEAAVKREQAITQMTPQQIEAQVKQAPPTGGGLALAAIAALLLLG